MKYFHNARHQIILQRALVKFSAEASLTDPMTLEEARYSDRRLIHALGLRGGDGALKVFRTAKLSTLTLTDLENTLLEDVDWKIAKMKLAEPLWEYLRERGYIRDAIASEQAPLKKKDLFSQREAASTMMAMYGARETDNRNVAFSHLVGSDGKKEWVCYKFATRRRGYVLKSRFTIQLVHNEYFAITEEQRSSGRSESAGEYHEDSSGFGFVKSGRLWCYLREEKHDQPRFFCFWKIDKADFSSAPLPGYVVESDEEFTPGQYMLPVVLVDPDLDRKLWENSVDDLPYDNDEHIDTFPFTEEKIQHHKTNPKSNYPTGAYDFSPFVPDVVREILIENSKFEL